MKHSREEKLAKRLLQIDQKLLDDAYETDNARKLKRYVKSKKRPGPASRLRHSAAIAGTCFALLFGLALISLSFLPMPKKSASVPGETGTDDWRLPAGSDDSGQQPNSEIFVDSDEVTSINAAEYYRKKSNEFTEAYYLGDALPLDWTGSVESYVASGKASAELVQNYQLSDSMEVLPVLGQYLESTRLAVYLFYRDGALSGCATLAMDTTLNERQIEEFSRMDEQDHWYAEALSDEDCFLTISECRKNYPDFRILGIVFQTDGYPCVIPVGKMEGETSVKMVFGSLTEFRLVAPFQTIEQGRQAFEEYFDQKDKMLSDVIIYPWLKNPQNDGYFLRRYENQGCELPKYFLEYDNWVDIPLMDEQLEENHYTLYLLFQGNALIAEVVLARDGERFEIAWENAAPKDENGSYQTIEKSKYERIYSAATGIMPQSDICGVIFKDNDFHPYIKQGSMVQYYEADKNAFVNG